jgi:hypothetical protein
MADDPRTGSGGSTGSPKLSGAGGRLGLRNTGAEGEVAQAVVIPINATDISSRLSLFVAFNGIDWLLNVVLEGSGVAHGALREGVGHSRVALGFRFLGGNRGVGCLQLVGKGVHFRRLVRVPIAVPESPRGPKTGRR